MVFHLRIHVPRKIHFKSSHLRYASKTYSQNQVAVKLLGSFRLTAGNRHLHRYCIFTEQVSETVLQALHYSCASELHVFISILMTIEQIFLYFHRSIDYIFILRFESKIFFECFLFPEPFILYPNSTILLKPFISKCF